MLEAVVYVLTTVLRFYEWVVIIAAIYSMLVSFGVVDTRNRLVWTIGDFLYRATEPALRPIRNRLPNLGGLDFSPLILILLIQVAIMLIAKLYVALRFGDWQSFVL